ncbi:MAG: OmpA family protein [Pseudomonadota bacterium]
MTAFTKTLSSAAVLGVVAVSTLTTTDANAWTKRSDAALVNKMIHSLSPGARAGNSYKHKYHRKHSGWKKHRRYGWKPKHRYHRHYAKKHYGYYDRSYDGRYHADFRYGFAKRYGWKHNPWIYKSRRVGHLDLQVFFRSGSAHLTHHAFRVLDSLGDALSYGKLRHRHFLIGGHTDAAGTGYANEVLSKRRAQAVKSYLVRHFGISPRRLVTVGYGENRLAYPGRPYSKANRRVEVQIISRARANRIRNRQVSYSAY